jgi:hypothetical protein
MNKKPLRRRSSPTGPCEAIQACDRVSHEGVATMRAGLFALPSIAVAAINVGMLSGNGALLLFGLAAFLIALALLMTALIDRRRARGGVRYERTLDDAR